MNERNWSVLSLIRFCLALQIVFVHIGTAVKPSYALQFFGQLTPVACFFVISGFSIAHSVTLRRSGFYLRRLRRIFPLAEAGIIYAVALAWFSGNKMTDIYSSPVLIPSAEATITTMILLNGVGIIKTPLVLATYWSLSCEEFYYILSPYIKKLSELKINTVLCISFLIYFSQVLCFPQIPLPFPNFALAHITLFWLWLLGFQVYKNPRNFLLLCGLIIACISIIAVDKGRIGALYLIAPVLFCVWNIRNLTVPKKLVSLAIYLGDISYPLYLFHFPTIIFLVPYAKSHNLFQTTFVCLASSLTVSMLAYHLIDVPPRKRRHHPQLL